MNKYTILILAVLMLPFGHAMAEDTDCREPCEEPNDPKERSNGGPPCVKLYDPATQGCCKKRDGSYEISNVPEDGDPCQAAADAGLRDGSDGGVICYNGEMYACSWASGGTSDNRAAWDECIKTHEREHFDATDCPDECIVSRPPPRPGVNLACEECDARTIHVQCLIDAYPCGNPPADFETWVPGPSASQCEFDWWVEVSAQQVARNAACRACVR